MIFKQKAAWKEVALVFGLSRHRYFATGYHLG